MDFNAKDVYLQGGIVMHLNEEMNLSKKAFT